MYDVQRTRLILLVSGLLGLTVGCVRVIQDPPPATTVPNDQAAEQPTPVEDPPTLADRRMDRVAETCWWMERSDVAHLIDGGQALDASPFGPMTSLDLWAIDAVFLPDGRVPDCPVGPFVCEACAFAIVDEALRLNGASTSTPRTDCWWLLDEDLEWLIRTNRIAFESGVSPWENLNTLLDDCFVTEPLLSRFESWVQPLTPALVTLVDLHCQDCSTAIIAEALR